METFAAWRAGVYRLLGGLLLHPDEPRLAQLAAVARDLGEDEDALAALAFFEAWRGLRGALEAAPERTSSLQSEYVRLFEVGPAGSLCAPYESWHVVDERPDAAWVSALLAGLYARAGLATAGRRGESPDHAAVELEFMAALCERERAAWARTDVDDAIRLLREERSFLRLHLGRWIPTLAREIDAAATELLYRAVAQVLNAFIYQDHNLVRELVRGVVGSRAQAARDRAPAIRRPAG